MTFQTALCDLLGIEYPIVQSGMGSVAGQDLAAEVSRAGGLGVLGGLLKTAEPPRAHMSAGSPLTILLGALVLLAMSAGACTSAAPRPLAPPVAQTQTTITRDEAAAALQTARARIERREYAAARASLVRVAGDADRWGWYDVASDAHFMLGEVLERESREVVERERASRDAADAYARAYDASRRLGDRRRGLRDLNALTNALLDARAHQKASEAASEAYSLAVSERDLVAQATAQNNLAESNRMAGRLDAARDGYGRALDLARQAGDRITQASILLNLGASERRAGRLDVARAHFAEARDLARELSDVRAGAYADWNLQQIDAEIRGREGRR